MSPVKVRNSKSSSPSLNTLQYLQTKHRTTFQSPDSKPEKPKDEPQGDPKNCNIRTAKDTIIELAKDKNQAIGFVPIGGYDSSLVSISWLPIQRSKSLIKIIPQGGVFILDVFPDGAAGKDGRLQPGDRIVEFNKEPMKLVEQEKAYQTIMRVTQGPVSTLDKLPEFLECISFLNVSDTHDRAPRRESGRGVRGRADEEGRKGLGSLLDRLQERQGSIRFRSGEREKLKSPRKRALVFTVANFHS